MAEAILGVVAEGVVSKALSFAAQEMSGALAVREDLETLAQQLEMIQAVLADAESKPLSSGPVRVWVERLKDAAADADMLLLYLFESTCISFRHGSQDQEDQLIARRGPRESAFLKSVEVQQLVSSPPPNTCCLLVHQPCQQVNSM